MLFLFAVCFALCLLHLSIFYVEKVPVIYGRVWIEVLKFSKWFQVIGLYKESQVLKF